MNPLTPQTFENITPTQFDALAKKAQDEVGVVITGNSGQASAKGFSLKYDYNPSRETLVLQCMDAPWPKSLFPDKITAAIAAMVNGN